MRSLLSVISLAVLLGAVGCGNEGPDESGRNGNEASGSPADERVECPISGTVFQRLDGIEVRQGDRTLLVCSPGCRFRAEMESK